MAEQREMVTEAEAVMGAVEQVAAARVEGWLAKEVAMEEEAGPVAL